MSELRNTILLYKRNIEHWDVWDGTKRLCKIRGEKGNYCVIPHYCGIENKGGFATVANCVKYICEYLIGEEV